MNDAGPARRDPKLCRSVEEVADSVSHLRLATAPAFEDAAGALGQPELALVLAHLAGDGDAGPDETTVLAGRLAAVELPGNCPSPSGRPQGDPCCRDSVLGASVKYAGNCLSP
jgi:hypothetical protein